MVQLLDLNKQYESISTELEDAILRVARSARYIGGDEVESFELKFSDFVGSKHAIGVSSGSDALLVSLMALGVGPGDEVITTPFSFFATVGAIVRVGAKPVFVDIDHDTYNINPHLIEDVITNNTKVIMPVHLYGQIADMSSIMDIADKYGLYVVEDTAQSIGAHNDGNFAGTIGNLGCYSFFPSKNLGCMGDGGMVVTNDDTLADMIRTMRVHGSKPKYFHSMVGGNFRLDPIQAAVLDVKIKYLDKWTTSRRSNAEFYYKSFEDLGYGFITPKSIGYHVYNQFVIRVSCRDELQDKLSSQGIGCAVYYPLCFHQQEVFMDQYGSMSFPEAEAASRDLLAIPVHPDLRTDEIKRVISSIINVLRD
jgi:dTDP-4-amino-4,6-dideoxygalactose transaminase